MPFRNLDCLTRSVEMVLKGESATCPQIEYDLGSAQATGLCPKVYVSLGCLVLHFDSGGSDSDSARLKIQANIYRYWQGTRKYEQLATIKHLLTRRCDGLYKMEQILADTSKYRQIWQILAGTRKHLQTGTY